MAPTDSISLWSYLVALLKIIILFIIDFDIILCHQPSPMKPFNENNVN